MKLIKLKNRNSVDCISTIVDDDDFEELSKYKWNPLYKKGKITYAKRTVKIKKENKYNLLLLHRVIMKETNPKIYIDHINGNTLDNRKINLRKCTHSENKTNSIKTHGTSIYKGVFKCIDKRTLSKESIKWVASCSKNKVRYSKKFKTEIEAAIWYNKKAIELHGEFANLNIIKKCIKENGFQMLLKKENT